MRGLDTNVLVRYLAQDDPDQSRRANSLLQEAASQGERCFINSVVLCELVWVLRGAYGYEKDEICMVIDKLLSTVEFSIEDKELAYRALEDYRSGGDFADHLIGWRNQKAGCDITVTFDRNLKNSLRFTVL
jgi:predicted nucleic-acid-binding protein